MQNKHFLREQSTDVQADRMLLSTAEDVMDAAEKDAERLAAYGQVAEYRRLLGDIDGAIDTSQQAIELARTLRDPGREAAHMIRLATALQYDDKHKFAIMMFDEVISRADEPGFKANEHFAEQHKGKCLAEMGEYDDARASFERARELRAELDDFRLMASTVAAMDELDEWKHADETVSSDS